MTPDRELLQHYAATNSEDAFAEVVRRHVNLVYSAALRQVNGDAHLAHDVAQTVFTDLARKAGALARHESLTGWLYTSAHFAAAKIIRGENRRRDREEKFMREPTNNSGMGSLPVHSAPDPDWEKLRPTIDDAMHELKTADREAVLLRYFENRPFAEVGAKLGLNENAARMRVERAVEKLRGILTKRGIGTIAALATVISANAVQTAPVGLAATLTTTSLTTAGTLTLAKIITTMKLKLIFSALVVASAATALVMQHQTQTKLAGENESLRQQITQLQTDNAGLSNRVAALSNSSALPNDQFNELLKLRGEVGVLRRQVDELGKMHEQSRQIGSKAISEEQQKRMAEMAKENGKMNDARIYCAAIQQYVLEHGGETPTDLSQLNKYLRSPNSGLSGTNEFEVIKEGKITDASYPEIVIVLRDKEVQPIGKSGKIWGRLYGFADGNIKTITSGDGNFDAFEQKHIFLSAPSQ